MEPPEPVSKNIDILWILAPFGEPFGIHFGAKVHKKCQIFEKLVMRGGRPKEQKNIRVKFTLLRTPTATLLHA